MEITEDQKFEKSAKLCIHRLRKILLPYEYERTVILCVYNVIKCKIELTKFQRKWKKLH